MKYALIRRHEGQHATALMCDLLSVSRSGYYEWRGRPTPPRAQADESLLRAIRRIYHDHKGRTGSPRITWALRHEGWRVGKNRVARLMRQNALRAKAARKSLPAAMAGQGNDQLRSQSAGGPQPAEPGLQRATTEPEVGSRHNVFSHGRRLVVFLPWCSTSAPAKSRAGRCPNG